ncbi:hypothetical protein BD779DRAFT_1474964 [Infundibulicybe gibba]|nr:hypothetical protein BD779DRAFT_1474964 [Infundibulicybe gibba]
MWRGWETRRVRDNAPGTTGARGIVLGGGGMQLWAREMLAKRGWDGATHWRSRREHARDPKIGGYIPDVAVIHIELEPLQELEAGGNNKRLGGCGFSYSTRRATEAEAKGVADKGGGVGMLTSGIGVDGGRARLGKMGGEALGVVGEPKGVVLMGMLRWYGLNCKDRQGVNRDVKKSDGPVRIFTHIESGCAERLKGGRQRMAWLGAIKIKSTNRRVGRRSVSELHVTVSDAGASAEERWVIIPEHTEGIQLHSEVSSGKEWGWASNFEHEQPVHSLTPSPWRLRTYGHAVAPQTHTTSMRFMVPFGNTLSESRPYCIKTLRSDDGIKLGRGADDPRNPQAGDAAALGDDEHTTARFFLLVRAPFLAHVWLSRFPDHATSKLTSQPRIHQPSPSSIIRVLGRLMEWRSRKISTLRARYTPTSSMFILRRFAGLRSTGGEKAARALEYNAKVPGGSETVISKTDKAATTMALGGEKAARGLPYDLAHSLGAEDLCSPEREMDTPCFDLPVIDTRKLIAGVIRQHPVARAWKNFARVSRMGVVFLMPETTKIQSWGPGSKLSVTKNARETFVPLITLRGGQVEDRSWPSSAYLHHWQSTWWVDVRLGHMYILCMILANAKQ